MPDRRILPYATVLLLLPILVAAFDWSVWIAIGLVLLMLLWRWLISLSTFVRAGKPSKPVLHTMAASHFVEKVRWNMDVAGIDYVEKPAAGTLGAFFLGRTVPSLTFRTGAVTSCIGNSPEILRYLWGAYSIPLGDAVRHLEPTAERADLEERLDRYGRNLQVWIYHHILDERELCLRAWGVDDPKVPIWQRFVLRLAQPLLARLVRRSFRVSSEHYEKVCHHIEDLLGDIDTRLADGRRSILGGDEFNYTDYAFAAFTGLWLQPRDYGGGQAQAVRIERGQAPNPMRADIERWCEDYPRAVEWVQRLYAEERTAASTP